MIKGWVTWVVAGCTAVYAVGGFAFGIHDGAKMSELLIVAGGLIGLGRKLDRAGLGE